MAIWSKLFDKKNKDEDSDGQEQYFKDEYKSIEKKAPEKAKPQPKAAGTSAKKEKSAPAAAKPVAKSTSAKSEEKSTKSAAKPASAKATTSAKPQETKAPAKKTANSKTTTAKKAETKSTPSTKSTAKTTKSAPKAEKPVAKTKAAKDVEIVDDSPEVKGAVAVKEGKETANGKFDIRRAKDGRYFFSLYASNHTVIAYSQIYSSITAVNTGIASVIANADKTEIEDTTLKKPVSLPCPKWEIYIDKAGEYRFRLYATNGLCICHSSHGYATKGGCKGGIESIKRFAEDATVDKSYLK